MFKAMKSVYCYNLPETRSIMEDFSFPHDWMNNSLDPKKLKDWSEWDTNLKGGLQLDIPVNDSGYVDWDEIHVPIIDRIVEIYSGVVPTLSSFKYRYFTSGSNEGIRSVIAEFASNITYFRRRVHVLTGEYEGYSQYAQMYGIDVVEEGSWGTVNTNYKYDGVWIISNPSAVDGNIIPNKFIRELCDSGNKVILDLSYVGSTMKYIYDVSHPNISHVFLSWSKPYGLFRYRIGFTFSREETKTLYGNRWFKDIERLFQALVIAERIGPEYVWKKYHPLQSKIISDINKEYTSRIVPSDVFLLGYDYPKVFYPEEKRTQFMIPYKRGNSFRFCLTPYFEEYERKI